MAFCTMHHAITACIFPECGVHFHGRLGRLGGLWAVAAGLPLSTRTCDVAGGQPAFLGARGAEIAPAQPPFPSALLTNLFCSGWARRGPRPEQRF